MSATYQPPLPGVLLAIEVGVMTPWPEAAGESDGCDHLDVYTVAGDCTRCERQAFNTRDEQAVARELTRDASTHGP